MRSAIGIDVAASPDLVFALARDVERWPRLLPHYVRADRVREHVDGSLVIEFVARRPFVSVLGLGVPVAWRSRVWAEPSTRRLRFVHLGGATDGMDVTWLIEPRPAGCRVTIEHRFRRVLSVPLVGAWLSAWLGTDLWPAAIDRLFVRPIAGRTLATFKALAEALAEAVAGSPAESSADPRPERVAIAAAEPASESADAPRTNHSP
jgi:ribosome-associated toxin RatA of RatAB toxin-antitoxin module